MRDEIIISPRNGLTRTTPSENRRKMELCLERINGRQISSDPRHPSERKGVLASATVIDLPRVCAVHDQPYIARYVAQGNEPYRFAQCIRFTESLGDQYRDSARNLQIYGIEFGEEGCAWCGANGFGAIRCSSCGAEVCYGKTTARRYFNCRASCQAHGTLVDNDRPIYGVRPQLRPPGQRGTSR